jgi:hypothetical protein
MPLNDRPDFQRWLAGVESLHAGLEAGIDPSPAPAQCCRSCGIDLKAFDSRCGECMVCLAERFGREQTEDAAYVGRVLMIGLLSVPNVPLDVARTSIEDVLDEYGELAQARETLYGASA